VVALVPARDEEATVGRTVRALRGVEGVDEVVVVADGCTDGTAEEARRSGARVLVTPCPVGKGGALEGALDRVGRAGVYLLVDADTGDSAGEAAALLAPVLDGRLDCAVGVLPQAGGGGFGAVRALSRTAVRLLTGADLRAPLSGQRALTARAVDAARPLASGFGVETALAIDLLRLGFRVGEVEVAMRHRVTGRDVPGFVHRARQAVDIARAVLPRALGFR
jgi:glucosyl-3-phosphoglycerate synthase